MKLIFPTFYQISKARLLQEWHFRQSVLLEMLNLHLTSPSLILFSSIWATKASSLMSKVPWGIIAFPVSQCIRSAAGLVGHQRVRICCVTFTEHWVQCSIVVTPAEPEPWESRWGGPSSCSRVGACSLQQYRNLCSQTASKGQGSCISRPKMHPLLIPSVDFHSQITPLCPAHPSYSSGQPFSPLRPEYLSPTCPPYAVRLYLLEKGLNSALQSSREAECLLKAPASAERTAYNITVPSPLFIPQPTTFGLKWVVFVSAGRADGRGKYSMVRYFSVPVPLPPPVPSVSYFLPPLRKGWAQTEFQDCYCLKAWHN